VFFIVCLINLKNFSVVCIFKEHPGEFSSTIFIAIC